MTRVTTEIFNHYIFWLELRTIRIMSEDKHNNTYYFPYKCDNHKSKIFKIKENDMKTSSQILQNI